MKYYNIYDMHTHSDDSFDGNQSCVLLCESAVQKGARGIAITDHLDIDDKSLNVRNFVVNQYIHTSRAKSAFSSDLEVIQGIELGQGIYRKELSERIMEDIKYDFVLGAIHNLENEEDFYFLEFTKDNVKDLLTRYFNDIYELVKWDKTDSLAHLTYPLRYIIGKYNINVNFDDYSDMIDEILKKLIENKKAIELNVSSLNKYHNDFMPGIEIIKRYKELGGEYVTVGSDAHYSNGVCTDIDKAYDALSECGFEKFTIYKNREPHLLPIV